MNEALLPTLEELDAEAARRSLAEFVRQSWHVLEPGVRLDWNWHLDAICDHVQAVLEDWIEKQRNPERHQRAQNLVCTVPPGAMKSRITSVCAPAWMWLRYPSWRVICLSANPTVALRDAVFCRDLIESDWYQRMFRPAWSLKEDQDAKGLYALTSGGSRQSMGFGSRIVGSRADALIIDDPHDAEEVHSEAIRRTVLDRWDGAIGNRVNDLRSSVRIGIMQRLHEEDWAGHVLRQGGWAHLRLPMEAESDAQRRAACKCETCQRGTTFLGWRDPRKPGELMFPQRFPPSVLASERIRLGSAGYAGQMQQRPTAESGGMLKKAWWRRYALEPREQAARCVELMQSWDCTFDGKADSDFVVGQVWGRRGADRFLLDQVRGQWDIVETAAQLVELSEKWPQAELKLIEAKANGPALMQTMRGKVSGLVGFDPKKERGSKAAGVAAIVPLIEAGNVWLPAVAEWVDGFIDECAAFPRGAHDDQIDPMTQALVRWQGMNDAPPEERRPGTREWYEAEERAMLERTMERQQNADAWGEKYEW